MQCYFFNKHKYYEILFNFLGFSLCGDEEYFVLSGSFSQYVNVNNITRLYMLFVFCRIYLGFDQELSGTGIGYFKINK